MEEFEKNLNQFQREAVFYKDGPIMVIAGAGSGKTRVITYRIAYLIKNHNIPPYNILGVTFTNKAADEMRERIFSLLGKRFDEMLIKTFHSTCAWILRRESIYLGLPSNFNILDEIDQKTLIKEILKNLQIDFKNDELKIIIEKISKWKNLNLNPELTIKNQFDERIFEIYRNYENYKKSLNLLDFDDLLLKTVELFKKEKKVLEKYENLFKYILVDEFQDTNLVQYEFIKLLGINHQNVCVVGDEDQAIYSWRGATIQNIRNFQKDFKNVKIIVLEQNYRSTQNILNFANEIINQNYSRATQKNLWSLNGKGDLVKVYKFDSSAAEAKFVASEIIKLKYSSNYKYKDFAIFFRVNYLSRAIENALKSYSIPYIFVGGIRFFERKEIKDLIAYLKVIENENDEISLSRIINIPPRGIGNVTIEKIKKFALENNFSLFKSLENIENIPKISNETKNKVIQFIEKIKNLKKIKDDFKLSDFVKNVINEFDYLKYLEENSDEDFEFRKGNIDELIEHITELEKNSKIDLRTYLETISLSSEIDELDEKEDAVSIMTLHNAKGLEFKVVFIIGVQDAILPHIKSLNSESLDEIDEERRLLYVGVTRAKEKLFITYPVFRITFDKPIKGDASRFLAEIPEDKFEFYDLTTYRSYYEERYF